MTSRAPKIVMQTLVLRVYVKFIEIISAWSKRYI